MHPKWNELSRKCTMLTFSIRLGDDDDAPELSHAMVAMYVKNHNFGASTLLGEIQS